MNNGKLVVVVDLDKSFVNNAEVFHRNSIAFLKSKGVDTLRGTPIEVLGEEDIAGLIESIDHAAYMHQYRLSAEFINQPPSEGYMEFLNILRDPFIEVHIVTGRGDFEPPYRVHEKRETLEYVKQYDIPHKSIEFRAWNKCPILQDLKTDVVIEDCPRILLGYRGMPWTTFQMTNPYTDTFFRYCIQVKSLREVSSYLYTTYPELSKYANN